MKHFWTDGDHKRLQAVSSYEGAAEVALTILSRMNRTGNEVVQICGPISTGGLGNLADNTARFQLAIDHAIHNGLMVFDQIPFQQTIVRLCRPKRDGGGYDWGILEIFYRKIFESGYVHRTLFLPGWEGSTGARWERKLVTKLGLIVEEYPLGWLELLE